MFCIAHLAIEWGFERLAPRVSLAFLVELVNEDARRRGGVVPLELHHVFQWEGLVIKDNPGVLGRNILVLQLVVLVKGAARALGVLLIVVLIVAVRGVRSIIGRSAQRSPPSGRPAASGVRRGCTAQSARRSARGGASLLCPVGELVREVQGVPFGLLLEEHVVEELVGGSKYGVCARRWRRRQLHRRHWGDACAAGRGRKVRRRHVRGVSNLQNVVPALWCNRRPSRAPVRAREEVLVGLS